MKFHLDADQSNTSAAVARTAHGLDCTSSHELMLDSLTDEGPLLYAAQEGRCIVTRNGPHFIMLTRRFVEEGLPDAGVLILPKSMEDFEFARIARALAWFHRRFPNGVPNYFVTYLADPPASAI